VLLQVAAELADGHPVDPCATSVASPRNASFRFSRLHTSSLSWMVLAGFRVHASPGAIGLFPSGLTGFTFRSDGSPVSSGCSAVVAPEIHVYSPLLSFGSSITVPVGLSVDSTFRRLECLTSLADDVIYYTLC